MSSYITLRTFLSEELLLDEEQTRQVLKFFFKGGTHLYRWFNHE